MKPKKPSRFVVILSVLVGVLLGCDMPSLVTNVETSSLSAPTTALTTYEPVDETVTCTYYVAPNGSERLAMQPSPELLFRKLLTLSNPTGVIVRRNRVMRNHLNGIKLWAEGRIDNNVVWWQGSSALWVGTFAQKQLTATEEARIVALVKKAVS